MDTKDILNQCLDEVRSGGDVEECLKRHPELAGELEPLLMSALEVRPGEEPSPQPSLQFRAELGRRLDAAWQARPRRRQAHGWFLGRRWALAGALALALLIGGASTVWASSSSVPGEVLYPAKQAGEEVRQTFTFSRSAKAGLQAQLAARRLREIAAMAGQGRLEEVARLVRRLDGNLSQLERMAAQENNEQTKARLRLALEKNATLDLELLNRVVERLPEARQARLRPWLEQAEARFDRAWTNLRPLGGPGQASPNVRPPWRRATPPAGGMQ